MSEVIPIEGKKKRHHSDVYEDLDDKLRDIFAVAMLLGEVDSDNIGPEQVNATGYCLTRMIEEAQRLNEEHLKQWRGGAK